MVVDAIGRYRNGDEDALLEIWPAPVPSDLPRFMRSAQAEPLVGGISLDPYLFSVQSARGSNPGLTQVLSLVGQLRRTVRALPDIAARADPQADRVANSILKTAQQIETSPPQGVPEADLKRFVGAVQRLPPISRELMEPRGEPVPDALRKRVEAAVEDVARELALLRSLSVLPP